MTENLTPIVMSESVSPMANGRRLPPIYRVTMLRGKFFLEKRVSRTGWKSFATSTDYMAIHQGLHEHAKRVKPMDFQRLSPLQQ